MFFLPYLNAVWLEAPPPLGHGAWGTRTTAIARTVNPSARVVGGGGGI